MNTSFRDARASLGRWGDHPVYGAGPTLETLVSGLESPRLVTPELVEGPIFARVPLSGPPLVGFSAFLNGIQQSRVVLHAGLVPIVHGTVAAVIRVRHDRRLTTHPAGPRIERALFAPRPLVPPDLWHDLATLGAVDTSPADVHPSTLLERAVHVVQRAREAAERALAASWADDGVLWVDGTLAATHPRMVGVVRTHRTLYAAPEALATICELAVGERSSVFLPAGRPVLSWYVRLRSPAGRDPLWGLLRVEVEDTGSVSERADLVSRWVLAEATPLALPDPRWDTLVYGVRDCEQYLHAIC